MAEAIAQIGLQIKEAIADLGNELNISHDLGAIPYFNGNPNDVDRFVKAIEAAPRITSDGDSTGIDALKVRMAHARTTGLAKTCLSGYISQTRSADISWTAVKERLYANFGKPRDARISLERLRKFRQTNEMSVAVFAMLIRNEIPHAFPNSNPSDALVEREVSSIFVKGLLNKRIKAKLIAADHATLKENLDLAVKESKTQARIAAFNATTGPNETEVPYHEPMDCSFLNEIQAHQYNLDMPVNYPETLQCAEQFENNTPLDPSLLEYDNVYSPLQNAPVYDPSPIGSDSALYFDPTVEFPPQENEFSYEESNINAINGSQFRRTCHRCGSVWHLVAQCPIKPLNMQQYLPRIPGVRQQRYAYYQQAKQATARAHTHTADL